MFARVVWRCTFVFMTNKIVWPLKPMTRERAYTARPVPPEAFFICSAIFHYLGPAFAVLLFARVDVLGVAWLRIASAAVVFRSEEHTSELQSRFDLVCRLLLEKKKVAIWWPSL